jgi:ABC-type glycerol-3-phosphate transport system substrate-binding protein
MRRARFHLALAAALALCLASGCARKTGEIAGGGGAAPSPAGKRILLTVLAGQSTTDAGTEEMIDDLLEKATPGIELDWERVDWGVGFQSQMRAKFAAGEVPDIMIGKAQDVATYLPSGNLAPIPSKVLACIQDQALGPVSSGGIAYGAPYNALYQGVFYNEDIFRSLGLEPPRSRAELARVEAALRRAGITPYATHFEELWYTGNVVMQFALGEIFEKEPDWGDRFRSGRVGFAESEGFERCFGYLRGMLEDSWKDAFSIGVAECDERFAKGQAAMYVSGSWSLQTIAAVNPGMRLGLFPYPNSTGDAKLIYEPNMTFMKSSRTEHPEEVDSALEAIFASVDLATEILDFTKSTSLLKATGSEPPLLVQADIDRRRAMGGIVDATIGNTQLIWSFQDALADRLQEWLQGRASLDSVMSYADRARSLSGPR